MGVEAIEYAEPTDAQIDESAAISLDLAVKTAAAWRQQLLAKYPNVGTPGSLDAEATTSGIALAALMIMTDAIIAMEPDLATRVAMFQEIVDVGGMYILTATDLAQTVKLSAASRVAGLGA